MNTVSSIALSGMNAARQNLDSAAHNIANGQTDGFKRQLVTQRELPGGGVTATVETAQSIGSDLPVDMVHEIEATYSFKANLHTMRTHQDMMGTLLNLKA